jgi:hypothetical protein
MESVGGFGKYMKRRVDSTRCGCGCTCYCETFVDADGLCDGTFDSAHDEGWY